LYQLQITAENEAGKSDVVAGKITLFRNDYVGSDRGEQFSGTQRDETFDAGSGDDVIDAGAGNDVLMGGKGNDLLIGGSGDDMYLYTLGDGNDTIEDHEGDDRLVLHDILKEKVYFTLSANDLILHIGEDNSTIVIKNWKENSAKIEKIIFDDDPEISLEDFDLPMVDPDAGIVDLSKLGNSSAVQVTEGRIVPLGDGYNSVDHWIFDFDGGNLEIDLLSELANNGQSYIDIDRDGVQSGVDVYIYLYQRDVNGNWQTIAGNDDSSSGQEDGSSHRYDSYLNVDLAEGEYMLAVSNYSLSASTALEDRNSAGSYPNGGPYQITFNSVLEFSEFPQNANNNLYGSDHYNFYVLSNDLDGYNMDGLYIENPIMVDENGTVNDNLGRIGTDSRYLSYYPEDNFMQNNGTVEVNVVYDVVNQNGSAVRSLLRLKSDFFTLYPY